MVFIMVGLLSGIHVDFCLKLQWLKGGALSACRSYNAPPELGSHRAIWDLLKLSFLADADSLPSFLPKWARNLALWWKVLRSHLSSAISGSPGLWQKVRPFLSRLSWTLLKSCFDKFTTDLDSHSLINSLVICRLKLDLIKLEQISCNGGTLWTSDTTVL